MAINGALGGLVAITAGCAFVEPICAVVIGGIAGLLVVFAVPFFDSIRADDPVGAIAVHGGLRHLRHHCRRVVRRNRRPFLRRRIRIAWDTITWSYLCILVGVWRHVRIVQPWAKATVGVRVSLEDEMEGLDISEHGMTAYNDLEFNPLKT